MNVGDNIKFLNNSGEIDECICVILEINGDHCRVKRPNGEIFRIFHDRMIPAEKTSEEMVDMSEEFDPNDGLAKNEEIWVKHNSFSDTVICITYAIIDPKGSSYKSINTYNGVAKKIMEYSMKSYTGLINKLLKRGYEKQD